MLLVIVLKIKNKNRLALKLCQKNYINFGYDDWEVQWYKSLGAIFFPVVLLWIFITWISDLCTGNNFINKEE